MTALGIFLLIYSVAVVLIGVFKPGTIWKIVKLKTGKNRSDRFTEIFIYSWAAITTVLGILCLTIWA